MSGQGLGRVVALSILLAAAFAAPALSQTQQTSAELAAYGKRVFNHLNREVRFFLIGLRERPAGTPVLFFTLDSGGNIRTAEIKKSSGNASLDAEALAAVRRASPFPAASDGRDHPFSVPIKFYGSPRRNLRR